MDLLFKEEAFQGIIMNSIEYDVIVENLEIIQEAMLSKRLLLIESSKDKKEVEKFVEKYVKDVKEFVNKTTNKADRLRKISKILAYITLGSSLVMILVSIGGGVTATSVTGSILTKAMVSKKIISITEVILSISLLTTMLSSIASFITGELARKVMLKLKPIKQQLEIYRSRTDSYKVQDKLDKLIIKIDTVIDKVSDDTASERVSSHSF